MSVQVSDEGNISATNVSIKKATFAVWISVSLCAAAMLGRDPGRCLKQKKREPISYALTLLKYAIGQCCWHLEILRTPHRTAILFDPILSPFDFDIASFLV